MIVVVGSLFFKRLKVIDLSKIDSQILFVLWKLYGVQVSQLAVLLGVDEVKVTRRVRALRERGYVDNALVLGDGEKALVWLKKKGMRALGELEEYAWIPDTERRENKPSNMLAKHILGEAKIAAWFALPKEARRKHDLMTVPFSYYQTERDVRSVAYVLDGKTPKYVDKGLHMPDALYRSRADGAVAIEYERTRKPRNVRNTLITNMRQNSKRFNKQIWVTAHKAGLDVSDKAAKYPDWDIEVIEMRDVEDDLAAYMKSDVEKVNLIGEGHVISKPLSKLPLVADPVVSEGVKSVEKAANVTGNGDTKADVATRLGLNTKR